MRRRGKSTPTLTRLTDADEGATAASLEEERSRRLEERRPAPAPGHRGTCGRELISCVPLIPPPPVTTPGPCSPPMMAPSQNHTVSVGMRRPLN